MEGSAGCNLLYIAGRNLGISVVLLNLPRHDYGIPHHISGIIRCIDIETGAGTPFGFLYVESPTIAAHFRDDSGGPDHLTIVCGSITTGDIALYAIYGDERIWLYGLHVVHIPGNQPVMAEFIDQDPPYSNYIVHTQGYVSGGNIAVGAPIRYNILVCLGFRHHSAIYVEKDALVHLRAIGSRIGNIDDPYRIHVEGMAAGMDCNGRNIGKGNLRQMIILRNSPRYRNRIPDGNGISKTRGIVEIDINARIGTPILHLYVESLSVPAHLRHDSRSYNRLPCVCGRIGAGKHIPLYFIYGNVGLRN